MKAFGSDTFGKYPTFVFGCAMTVVMVLIYTHLGHVSLVTAITVNVLMFVGIFSRMIPSQALMSAIPDASQRGSFSAVSASVQQLSGGLGFLQPGSDFRRFFGRKIGAATAATFEFIRVVEPLVRLAPT